MNWNDVEGIGTLGMFIVCLIALFKKSSVDVTPQPLTVELAKQFADKHDVDRKFEENKRDHESIFSKIGGVDRGAGAKISSEVQAIHVRINLLDKSNGRLEAATEMQNQQLAQMDAKITRLLERGGRS